MAGGERKKEKRGWESFDLLLTGLPLSRLWPLARRFCEATFNEREGFEEEENHRPQTENVRL